jgi:hypothetical protein
VVGSVGRSNRKARVCLAGFALVWLLCGIVLPGFGQGRNQTVSRSPHGNLSIPCQNCHTSVGWKPIRAAPEFDHDKTSFPLRGLHQGVSCTQCHAKPVFSNTGTHCADCHADIHRRQMGADCAQCHTVKGWNILLQTVREHDNRFPLVGGHAGLDCADCHKSEAVGQFQGLSIQCYSCHQSTFQQTTAPNHVASGFPTQCEQCHTINTWLGATFDHLKYTGFALTGMHATLDCVACHVGGKYKGTPATCVGCHLLDFQKTNNPNHVALGLPQTCQECHTTSAWQPASFNHNAVGFPLTGGHANLQCDQCHTNGNFNLTSTACVSCHLKDYQGTTNPNHSAAGIPQQCDICHTTAAWMPATFDHSKTAFPLTGAHVTVPCGQCHVNGNYNLTTTACVLCHLKDFQGTNNPNHVSAGFPQQCEVCHNTTSWLTATFNHSTTGFPLTGAHTTLQCSQCHTNGNYGLTNTACVACHLADFQGTTNPNHASVGFPQQCDVCHSTTAWMPATFNHNNTSFPLTGAHTTVACASCHVNNNYTTLLTDCYGCHQVDYSGTTNPNHVTAGFPTTCATCHTTTSWLGATFNHTWFNTNHGNANGVCSVCHTNPNDYSVFQCTNCHTKTRTDGEHQGIGGYVYNSVNCYTCHKNGGGG